MAAVRNIRAKFRCMDLDRSWNGKVTTARFLPVGPKGDAYPDGCEENRAFWEWTPGGEANLTFGTIEPEEVPFELGAAYYIDMAPADDGDWKLEVTARYESQLDIAVDRRWREEPMRNGRITMQIANEGAWPAFLEPGPGSAWSVEFTRADG